MFTINVQETCVAAAALGAPSTSTGPGATCTGGTLFRGDPVPAADVPFTIPSALAVQVRDVFGSWAFNSVAGAATGVSAEFVSPILPATVAAPGGYAVAYAVTPPGCPAGGGAPGGPCVTGPATSINFRADGPTPAVAGVRDFRAVQPFSVTLPVFTRVELYALRMLDLAPVDGVGDTPAEWVFIQRCLVPSPIIPGGGAQACTNGTGTVTGTDNGLERYWVYRFTGIPALPALHFGAAPTLRALGVNAAGFGLFSSPQP
jgi:hypothetical protein